jgi:uncharacterized protein (DUF1697 family)
MPAYVALLRGINVGGKRSFAMAKVRAALEGAGATAVQTYIQSGNAVFAHASRSEAKLVAQLAVALADAAGFAVPVVLRSAAHWQQVIANNPYDDVDNVHCMFLPAAPSAVSIDASDYAPEDFALIGRELYLHLPNGIGRSELAVALMRQKALAAATTRNWRTVLKLGELAA